MLAGLDLHAGRHGLGFSVAMPECRSFVLRGRSAVGGLARIARARALLARHGRLLPGPRRATERRLLARQPKGSRQH